MTMIRSARAAVVSRCATTIVVRARGQRIASPALTAASDARSSAAVASSSSRMSGIGQLRPRQRDELPLPGRQAPPALADLVVVPAGQPR